ncbi:MAG: DUF4387 domain-containing protein [Geminicoccaceae bacterium]
MTRHYLKDLAKTVRSKNAGVDKITFDIIFTDRDIYEKVRDSGSLTRERVERLFGVPPERITDFVTFDPAMAIKFTIRRERPSGSPGDADIFGAQQYPPLLDLEIDLDPEHDAG